MVPYEIYITIKGNIPSSETYMKLTGTHTRHNTFHRVQMIQINLVDYNVPQVEIKN